MIQDIFPHVFNNSYKDIRPAEGDPVICFKDGKILGRHDVDAHRLILPRADAKTDLIYLFSIDEDSYFLDLAPRDGQDGFLWFSVREIRDLGIEDQRMVFASFTAYHLAEWYRDNRFCGVCGKSLTIASDERALDCPACHKRIYPRINPAVIIGVKNGDRILITRYRQGYAHNALVAGFTEIGETLEQTVSREVMEEAGLKVKNIQYYKSQPWGMAADILMGFFCEVDGDDTIKMDEGELKYAEWIKREDIVLQPSDYSLTNEMMKVFKEGREV
ncbi:MAG: NAD(+) diphosphatase [Lachnospiraceae bacterium]|nr:NAD(+) diphosphatase [Lachnospiraceae bacterium]